MKVSIISEGGGMRGAYSLGVLDVLYSDFGLKRVDVVTGSSASIGNLAYYVSGQFYPGFHIWSEEVSKNSVLSFRNLFHRKPFLNVDFLVDNIFRKGERKLDVNNLLNSEVEIVIPLTNSKTGETIYLSNRNNFNGFNPWNVLKASMALPIVYNKKFVFGGESYFDGAYSNPLPVNHESVVNSEKIIILSSNNHQKVSAYSDYFISLMKPFLQEGVYSCLKMQKRIHKKKVRNLKRLKRKGAIVIKPSEKFSGLNNSRKNLARYIAEGKYNARNNSRLKQLVEKLKNSDRSDFYFN